MMRLLLAAAVLALGCEGTTRVTGPPASACSQHLDEATCRADPLGCAWYPNTRPCQVGQPCPSGWCYPRPVQSCTSPSDCTGALPASCLSCTNGSQGCAHFACVAGACEVEYCAPELQCISASDCNGALPAVCTACAGGALGCAHWGCTLGACIVQLCP